MCKGSSLLCCLLGFIFVVSCVGHSLARSPRAASDYMARAQKLLDETPLVDG